MTQRIIVRTCTLVLLTMIGTALLAQGLYYESVTKGGMLGDKEIPSSTYLMPKMFKHVSQPEGNAVILRMDQEKMYNIDPKEKTYSEMTFAEMEQQMKKMSAKVDSQMAQLEESMKNMPPEQRKMMEGMMGSKMGKPGAEVHLVRTDEKKKVSGFNCMKYVAKEGEKDLMTLWATKDVRGFESLRKDYEALTKRMMSMNPSFMKGLVDAMLKVDGFPMETEWGGMTVMVTKVEPRVTGAAEFAVPAGYTKTKPPMMQEEKTDEAPH
jgi:hypothetical protein